MPGFGAEVTPPFDVIQAMTDRVIQSPMLMQRAYRRAMIGVAQRMIGELEVEPPPARESYPLIWHSAKQRRYVMWLLRSTDNLPYQRTHALAQGWKYAIDDLASGGEFSVSNQAPEAQFVIGDSMQPMFFQIGWQPAAPIFMRYREESENVAIETWFTVTDFTAGVPA